MIIKKHSALDQLFGCYFHQDWTEEFEDSNEAVREIIKNEPRDNLLAGAEELEQLLALKLSESAYRDFMTNEVGCYFEPKSEGVTYGDWLLKLRAIFLDIAI